MLHRRILDSALGLVRSPAGSIRCAHRRRASVILNLHRVSDEDNPFWPPLSVGTFRHLLDLLEDTSDVVALGELDKEAVRPQVVLSFDDGYLDFHGTVMPILARRGLTCNLNIIPRCVETGKAPWNIRLYDLLHHAGRQGEQVVRLPGIGTIPTKGRNLARVGAQLSTSLKFLSSHERRKRLAAIAPMMAQLPQDARTSVMNINQVRNAARTHEIGLHSYSHESMGHQAPGFFYDDFAKGARFFQDSLGFSPSIYAFPNGDYRTGQPEWLTKQMVEHVLLVDDRPANPAKSIKPRIPIYGKKLATATARLHHARRAAA